MVENAGSGRLPQCRCRDTANLDNSVYPTAPFGRSRFYLCLGERARPSAVCVCVFVRRICPPPHTHSCGITATRRFGHNEICMVASSVQKSVLFKFSTSFDSVRFLPLTAHVYNAGGKSRDDSRLSGRTGSRTPTVLHFSQLYAIAENITRILYDANSEMVELRLDLRSKTRNDCVCFAQFQFCNSLPPNF